MRKVKMVCNIRAKTHNQAGRPVVMDRRVECGIDVEAGILKALRARRDHGAPFVGEYVEAITPEGERVVRILEEQWGEYSLIEG